MDYIAVNAKIKAMRAKLLTRPQYMDLCQPQPTFKGYVPTMAEELERIRLFLGSVQVRRILSLAMEDYEKAWAFIKTLPNGQTRQALTYIKGIEIDLHNILWIYRLKHYYTASPADIYPHLIPICYRINKESIKQMAESPGSAEVIVTALHSPYGHIFVSSNNIEQAISRDIRSAYSRLTKRYPCSIAGILSYFFDKKTEERNLAKIDEGHRYNLAPQEIFSHLWIN